MYLGMNVQLASQILEIVYFFIDLPRSLKSTDQVFNLICVKIGWKIQYFSFNKPIWKNLERSILTLPFHQSDYLTLKRN